MKSGSKSPIRSNNQGDTPVKQSNQSSPKKKAKRKKNKNENILCAIIALMKELDKSGLEFIKMDAKKRIHKIEQREKSGKPSEQSSDEEDSDY